MSWGEDNDEELQQKDDLQFGVLISFKSMINALNRICEETRDYDEKHPKDSLSNIWFGCMLVMSVFILFTYNVVAIATLPFLGFYTYVLIKISAAYKQFHYSRTKFWTLTIVVLLLIIAATTAAKIFILG